MNNPLISIIVPVYNGEKYLSECLDSILNKKYKNIELLIIDDGSTDSSGGIADSYAAKHGNVNALHQINKGVSAARNLGLGQAKGEYVSFIDADDYVDNDYISYLYTLILKNNAQISLVPTVRKFNQSIKHNTVGEADKDKFFVWSGKEAALQMLYYNVIISPCNKMISIDLIRNHNLHFNEQLSFGEGFNFSMDCFQRAEIVAVGSKLVYNYRVDNPNSVMTKFSLKMVTGSIEAQKAIQKSLIYSSSDMLRGCRYANWHTYCDCLNTIIGCNVKSDHMMLYKEIRKVCRKDAGCVFSSYVPIKDKIKGLLYFLNPYLTAKLINHFRPRKFTKKE